MVISVSESYEIHCDDVEVEKKVNELRLMENTIQNILKLQGKHKQDAPGTEWFITSPIEVEQIYKNNFENS